MEKRHESSLRPIFLNSQFLILNSPISYFLILNS